MPARFELGTGGIQRGLGDRASPARRRCSAARERPAERASARSRSSGLEVGVARAHREPVGLANGGQDLDLDGEVQVTGHAAG